MALSSPSSLLSNTKCEVVHKELHGSKSISYIERLSVMTDMTDMIGELVSEVLSDESGKKNPEAQLSK